MSRVATLRPHAEADLEDAFLWYEVRLPGLGSAFLGAIVERLVAIERRPEAYPEILPGIRRAPLRRFPFGIYYIVRDERLDVLAIHHARRATLRP